MVTKWVRAATFVAATAGTCVVGVAGNARAEGTSAHAWSEGIVISVQSAAQRVSALLRTARALHDAPHAACANEALSRLNASLRTAKASAAEVGAAESRSDVEGVRRASARLVTARESARAASSDVDACYAIDRGSEDRTTVHMRVDPDVVPVP